MADDRSGAQPDTSGAILLAALAGAAKSEKVDALLDRQAALVELQIADLKREDRIRHWSLRVRHINDVMRLAFEISIAIVLVTVVVFLISAIWTAAHDNSLVIEAFNVPQDMASRGLTGQVVAAQLQDKLAAMQNETDSARPETSYAHNWGEDIKVEIPNTGVSIGEFYRYLARWLGHQTHITGEVYRVQNGTIAITARTGDEGATVTGPEANLDGLIQTAAEKIYERTQPYRYAIFLGNDPRRENEVVAILRRLAINGSPGDRIWAHMGLSTIMSIATDPLGAPAEQAKDLPLAPDLALVPQNMGQYELGLDHEEAALGYLERAQERFQIDDGQINERARRISLPGTEAAVADLRGDYKAALQAKTEAAGMAEYAFIAAFARENTRYDYAGLHELTAAAGVSHERPPEGGPGLAAALDQRNLAAASLARDWPAVLAQGKKLEAAVRNLLSQAIYTRNFVDVVLTRQIWPFVARAMAMTGQVAGAEALIAKTPPDCTTCALNRANIAAAAGDWSGASTWFARTIAAAPSIPFAYADWGEMLLHQGKYDGAIDKFRQANLKGPQFADPLEMWGEALMQMNRSDLALAKFEEANKYAPNWGRLHLKWGEALTYAGQREDAKKQFAIASRLDLSPADRATLARVMRTHA